MRIIVKGGVWKNTEDEILKAAIASHHPSIYCDIKYGKNQWARISSLLVRKTAKQCKARWMEWLDPAIKKTEWSKEEDEKLLHLAKLMPTQWRTIAPIVGRTANQCLERYQKLLDEAEQADNAELGLTGVDDAGPSADDVRRLRPGEVDPDPENRPARPDPIDMDEDGKCKKEMLSEARARLANTQGKKAKRKARERQLEEARRLAILQKKRELKAAGILMRAKPKKGGMDYMADIPFEKQPAAGFYDTTTEQGKKYAAPLGKNLRQLEGKKRKQDIEEEDRKKKKQKEKNAKDKDADAMAHFLPSKDSQIQQQKEAQQISKRRRLVLPGPQVGEAELEEIVKIGQAGESARALVGESGNEASQGLLGEYSALGHARDARTPRTEKAPDNVLAEARNIRNLTMQQTPLLGEENTPMHELVGRSGFEGATPRGAVAATPNPIATPLRSGASDVSATPMSSVGGRPGATPLRTPMRDSLSINDAESMVGDTPRAERQRLHELKSQLKQGFMSLPQPQNELELVLPEDDPDGDDDVSRAMRIEDASEREARLEAIRKEQEAKALARRSQAVKRGLPRPIEFEASTFLAQLRLTDPMSVQDDLERSIAIEMAQLIEHDSILHPVAGSSRPGGGSSTLLSIDDDELAAARQLVQSELASSVGLPGANETVLRRAVALPSQEFDSTWRPLYDQLVYDPSQQRMVPRSSVTNDDLIQAYSQQLVLNRDRMARESAKAVKVEKKLGVTLGGYIARSKTLATKLNETVEDLSRTRIESHSFERLASNEHGAIVRRMEALRDEVNALQKRERDGQSRFRDLMEAKQTLTMAIEEMELEEAERINEQALEAMEAEGEEA
ncbi:BZ3500_MvSof-1268-A1-R1_Chr9g10706 [Microbotryum saponariae]|uniref:BZ3500_MvSof-1268-A1-R1_Chr9g10706 protein n=1 Tax=Microbotryum saponariae TaxID=289078 RepID=A0A2X0LVI8_9BASI|nr:BZ3501_MvSof-1269-A2-R1_Chr9g10454 [Microbotryum saponariae]SDA00555.1 BZ3500_MvSof-1268-A1-R1_Chr9g10706 [Microbotryum saponariae]